MITKHLLPHSWRLPGWISFILFLTIWISLQTYVVFFDPDFTPTLSTEGVWYADLVDEVIALGILGSLMIIGFSKEKVEDELVSLIRLEALQWGIYLNSAVLALCIICLYGFDFLYVMEYNMFTPLLIFIVRFNWLLRVKPVLEKRKEGIER